MKRDGIGATLPWRGDGLMKSALSLWADSLPPIGTCTPVQLTLPSIVIAVNCLSFILEPSALIPMKFKKLPELIADACVPPVLLLLLLLLLLLHYHRPICHEAITG